MVLEGPCYNSLNSKFRNVGCILPLLHQKLPQVQLDLCHLGFLSAVCDQSRNRCWGLWPLCCKRVGPWQPPLWDKAPFSTPGRVEELIPWGSLFSSCSHSWGRRCSSHQAAKFRSSVLKGWKENSSYHVTESSCSFPFVLEGNQVDGKDHFTFITLTTHTGFVTAPC